ncbi:MAG: hypothetical protein AB7U43_08560 [Desulfobacter sp.]
MTEYVRHKALSREFGRIKLSENDLFRISKIIEDLAAANDGTPNIEIISGDGEETFKARSSFFFISEDIPPEIRSVKITFSKYDSPVSCTAYFSSQPSRQAQVQVDGTDTCTVVAVFHELERVLKSRETVGSKFFLTLENNSFVGFAAFLAYALVTAATIYSIFDVPLNLAIKANKEFVKTGAYKTLLTIGWICVFTLPWVGGHLIENKIKKFFPPIEFDGRISDPNKPSRKAMVLFLSFIIIPIIINVISTILIEAFKR